MTVEGPALHVLLRRLAECPPDFLSEPGVVDVGAVVSDVSRGLGGTLLSTDQLRSLRTGDRNRSRVVLIASWLLYDEWFRDQRRFGPAVVDVLSSGETLTSLAALVDAAHFVSDSDRREELVRVLLRALGLRPLGESEAQSADRLATLSTVERNRVMRETRAAQQRVQEIREAMRRKAAEEAAAAYGRE